MMRHASAFAGPLPPPAAFASYDQTLAGAAERILKMAEEEQSERLALSRIQTEATARAMAEGAKARALGLHYGILSVVVLAGGAAFCVWRGASVAGSIFAGATLAATVRAFVGAGK